MTLGRNVIASLANAVLWLGSALLYVPIILDEVGTAGFGVWTIAQSLILFLSIAEVGFGAGVQRFAAVARGAGDRSGLTAVTWTSIAASSVLGALAMTVALLAAPEVVKLFDIPAGLRDGSEEMFRVLGGVVWAALVAAALGNTQQGLERYVQYSISSAISLVAFVAALVVLLPAEGLPGIAYAALGQQGVLILVRAVGVRDVLVGSRPALMAVSEARRLISFSAQMQMSAMSTYANTQTDKLVVGLIAPIATVGQLGIGSQVAEAGRAVSGAALSPMVARLSRLFGSGDQEGLRQIYTRLERLWTLTVVGATAIATASMYPLVAGWLGPGYGEAALLGSFLVVAFGVNLLTGVDTAYLRARGKPGLEARYGVMLTAANLALTVALGVIAGARGVVIATALAYLLATAWFFARLGPLIPHRRWPLAGMEVRVSVALVVVTAAVLGWGITMVELLPPGVALVPIGLGMSAALTAFMSVTTRVRPTIANARALIG